MKNKDILKSRGKYHVHNSLSVSIDEATFDQLITTRTVYILRRNQARLENHSIFADAIKAIDDEINKRDIEWFRENKS